MRTIGCFAAIAVLAMTAPLPAQVLTFGTEDCLGTGCYGMSDPTAGATLIGLAPDSVTLATMSFGHGYPFSPSAGDFAGGEQADEGVRPPFTGGRQAPGPCECVLYREDLQWR